MPDTAGLEMPGTSSGGGGIPQGVMIIGAIAGVVGLFLLLKNSGGGGTTAAGTSINAALGSIQEENMNLLGTTQAGFMQTSQQISALGSQDMAHYTQLSDSITSNFSDLNSQEAQYWAANNQQIANGFSTLGGQLSGLSSQVQGYQGQNSTSFQHINDLLNSLSNDVNTGNANSASYYQNLGALMNELSGQVTGTQADVNSLGRFLGWQFYQLPNRYSAYIPGQSPGNYGGSPIGML
ncbi:MAG TPA: hypothetical protein VGE97_09725 [Nitrososphaera sp.]|jgi:hypothetical protein